MIDVLAQAPADDDWDEDPPRRPPASTTAPVLTVDGFEGPLDWLLERVRSRQIDLARLSIVALIEAFGKAMQAALTHKPATSELMRWADWTVMAARLIELRSRLLLPADDPAARAAQTEAETLRRSLLTRAEMVTAAEWLDRRKQLGRDVFGRGQSAPPEAGQKTTDTSSYGYADDAMADDADRSDAAGQDDLTGLLRACLVALRLRQDTEAYQPRRLPFWSVADATLHIQQLLPALPAGATLLHFLPARIGRPAGADPGLHRRAALAATLIASLELARGDTLTLDQDALWQPIQVVMSGPLK